MLISGFGWTGENVWTFPFPTANPSYCEVIITEIIEVTEDNAPSTAVFFEEQETCIQPCS